MIAPILTCGVFVLSTPPFSPFPSHLLVVVGVTTLLPPCFLCLLLHLLHSPCGFFSFSAIFFHTIVSCPTLPPSPWKAVFLCTPIPPLLFSIFFLLLIPFHHPPSSSPSNPIFFAPIPILCFFLLPPSPGCPLRTASQPQCTFTTHQCQDPLFNVSPHCGCSRAVRGQVWRGVSSTL